MYSRQPIFSLSGKVHPYAKEHSILAFIKKSALNQFRPALIDNQETFDYQSLIPTVVLIAKKLKDLKVTQGSRVAILASPSCRLILLILAVLEVGASYVPIDPSYPKDRIRDILEDCQANCLVVTAETKFLAKENPLGFRILQMEEIDFKSYNVIPEINESTNNLSSGHYPAYTIYTSGTTGKPKGIIIPHQSISNHMLWMAEEFKLTSEDRFLLKTPLTFDPSVWEIFLPLFLGATLVIAPPETHKNPDIMAKIIEQYKVSILQLVPSILHQFLSFTPLKSTSSLRYVFVGGESLTPSTKKLFFEKMQCPLVNLYGPAEATIDSTFHLIERDIKQYERNYIGKPIYNTTLYILDEALEPVQEGEVGELFIAGDSLAIGYLNRPELNKQCFLENPFSSRKGDKFYKTGDLVKLHEGKLEYVGRVDHQIKVNGVRIETQALRDIILKTNEKIYDCLFEKQIHETYQYSMLVCYILSKENVNLSQIKSKLEEQFPSYMLPQKYYLSSASELSAHGKINLKQIKQEAESKQQKRCSDIATSKVMLFEIWERVLSTPVPSETLDFYDLGGDSITSHILAYEISTYFSIDFKPLSVLVYNTIEKQFKHLTQPGSIASEKCSNLICMNSAMPKKLFLVHPIGGTTFWYTHLAKLLDGKIQLYGIQDPSITDMSLNFKSIEEMAAHYGSLILKEQKQGTFLLGGASFGGTVAIEIARYLSRLNYGIDQVLLLDGWGVYPKELKDINYFKSSMRRQQMDWIDKFNQSNVEIDFFQDIFKIQLQRLEMLFHYKQQSIPFDIKLFKAQEIMPIFQPDAPFNHWENYAKNLSIFVVPGDHETMFLPPNVKTLSNKIESAYTKNFVEELEVEIGKINP